MNKSCCVCERALQDGDTVVAVVSSVYHYIASATTYAIERPTTCHKLAHSWCVSGEEVELA